MTDESRDLAAFAETPDALGGDGSHWDAADDANADASERFAGDEGTWAPALRDAVVHLYKRRFISKAQHPQHWDPLVRNLPLVRADLNNHNLTLVIDTTREVMFKKQAPIEDGAPTLLRDVSYSLEETALLVLLRSLTMDTADRVARVDHADLLTTLSEYRPAHVADEKAKAEKEARAIRKMIEIGILRRDANEEAYTIDRVIEAALPYDTLLALHEVLYNAPDSNGKPGEFDDEGDQ
ncbi:MAG: DUF4194 domain-containing protein [Ilumatobacter sp.]|uniref:DUF4194 domain-containing protein n=1 Tax=Ilumatobacter sp. TaxID=1967498 RepID=UPI003918D606